MNLKLPFGIRNGVLVDVSQVNRVFAATVFVQHAVTSWLPEKEIKSVTTLPIIDRLICAGAV